jgi:hypothetical protein
MTIVTTSSSGLVLSSGSFSNPVVISQGVTIRNTASTGVGISTTGSTQAFTIQNYGTVIAAYAIELHGADSTITNSATGFISATGGGFGVRFDVGAADGTVVNAGTIRSTNHSGVAFISATSGGFVTNSLGGLITGFTNGVYTEGGIVVVNAGSIAGTAVTPTTDGFGVNFKFGTNALTNMSTGTITGANVGVYGGATAFSNQVTNAGQITGLIGVELKDGGTIANLTAGKITGTSFGISIATASGTVTNAGTIRTTGSAGIAIDLAAGGTVVDYGAIIGSGGTAIYFGGSALTNNVLVLNPNFSISGVVQGGTAASNTLQLAAGTGGTGTLTGLGTEFNNFGVSVAANANWVLTGSNIMTGGFFPEAATYLGGAGTLTNAGYLTAEIGAGQVFGSETIAVGNFTNDGTIGVAAYDELSITTGVATGNGSSGTIVIGRYGILETEAAVSSGQIVVFADDTGELVVDDTADFAGAIAGMQAGDTLELNNLVFSTDSSAVLSGDTLMVTTDSGSAQFVLNGVAPGTQFTTQESDDGGVDVTMNNEIACFCVGTLIETDHGQVPVEELRIGDRVVTLSGALRPVRWIGYRSFDLTRHPAPERVQPIRIAANAFADAVPSRTLRLSPDHAVLLDGLLIPAKLLRNDASIVRETACKSVTYYHVELDGHDVLLAEGLPAESYLDTGNRSMFANARRPLLLHPAFDNDQVRRESESCMPFAADVIRVEPVYRRLAARAASFGLIPPRRDVTTDPALCVAIGDRLIRPVSHDSGRAVFALPAAPDHVRLVSRSVVPNALKAWVDDTRQLGVAVVRLTLHNGGTVETIPLDDPRLAGGWWDVEREGSRTWRWTDGDAVIPLNGCGHTVLEVELEGTLDYPIEAPPPAALCQPQAMAA